MATREEANEWLRRKYGIVASFSRALVEGLSAQQSDAEFNSVLEKSIQSIFDASNTKQAMKEPEGNRITDWPHAHFRRIITERDSRYGQG